MTKPDSYVICGTPRSGSTLLCKMLSRSGQAGQPHSYFRAEDIAEWAEHWGISTTGGIETAAFDRSYIAEMAKVGRGKTAFFGLRIMYASLTEAKRRLDRAAADGQQATLVERLEAAFGPSLFIYLRREDILGQAVSLVRAQQTGLWHLNADGSILEGTAKPPQPVYDGGRIAATLAELKRDNQAWDRFFAAHGIAPLKLTYEGVTAGPQQALAEILSHLGLDPAPAYSMTTPTAKMADATNLAWVERFSRENFR